MKIIIRLFIFFQIFVLSGLQVTIAYINNPITNQNNKDMSSIFDENQNSETDKDVNENRENSNEKSNEESNEESDENDWFYSLENYKLIESRASANLNLFYFSYKSPELSFLSPPPELI